MTDAARSGVGPIGSTGPGPTATAGGGPGVRADTVRTSGATGSPGLYPPATAGASGATGDTRRRAPYLIDDSGCFDVEDELPHTEPVLRGTDQGRPV